MFQMFCRDLLLGLFYKNIPLMYMRFICIEHNIIYNTNYKSNYIIDIPEISYYNLGDYLFYKTT